MAFSRVVELLLGDIHVNNTETQGPKTSKGIGWLTSHLYYCTTVQPEIPICAWVCSVPDAVSGQPCSKCTTLAKEPKSWLRSWDHHQMFAAGCTEKPPHFWGLLGYADFGMTFDLTNRWQNKLMADVFLNEQTVLLIFACLSEYFFLRCALAECLLR